MAERKLSAFYERYCAECEGEGVAPMVPRVVAEILREVGLVGEAEESATVH